ncbi:uncharacterized protein LOC131322058 isoform X2 [Rhododendron vialii]|uniref:uncharacterized protein LOC131322058 isoform X2 n=1 Tax=Rhododendron vialii TaxID=182163 RepID=UPI00265D931C|nr:uncharacterized protein LOC131322058 isoform X2 [Rhododendron vialii]
MAARAISLRLRLTRLRPITNPSLLRHFSSDSTSVRGQDNPRSEDSTVEASNKGNSFAEIGKGLRQLNSDHRAQKKENESEEHQETELTPQERFVPGSFVFPPRRRTTFIDHAKQLKKKRSWPELVGLLVHEAAWKIQEEMPEAQIEVVPPKFGYTLEFRYNRVRLHIDYSGKVRFAPEEG